MKRDLAGILVCASCRGKLNLSDAQGGDEITGGVLECASCDAKYPIRNGLPDLIPHRLHPDRHEIGDSTEGVGRANRDYHDRHAATYETDPHTNFMFFGACQKRIEEVVKWVAGRTEANISLDLGCGTGNVLKFQARLFKRALGIDLASAMMDLIPDSSADRIIATGTSAPFPDNTFDFVTAFSVLHHLFDPVDALREAHRVLRPGGILYTDWDFNRRFRTRLFFSLWLHNLNPFKAFKGFVDHFLMKDEENELFTKAEYHAFKEWLDAASLADSAKSIGFSEVHLVYHWNHPSIIGGDGRPLQPEPKGIVPVITLSRDPVVAFPIFSIIAVK